VTADLDAYRAAAADWLKAHVPLRSAAPTRGADEPSVVAADRARQLEMYEAGYVGITVPPHYGGQGLTPRHQRVWIEESAAYATPEPGGVASRVTLGIVVPTLLAHASEEQKQAWIPPMLRGDALWVQLLSEPGAGSDLAGILTRAERDGDSWVLTGTKVWSSGALSADYGICLARSDWEAPKHRGLTWFRVPLHDAAVTVRPIREINGGAEFCEEFLDGVAVGAEAVIGEVNGGWPVANTMLAVERAAGSGGGARPATGSGIAPDLVALAKAGDTLTDAAVRQLIARAHINDVMHRALTARLAEAMTAGGADPALASMIKLHAGIVQPLRAAAAMEIAGRPGVVWPAGSSEGATTADNFLNGRVMAIAGGSNQIQRNIIGERVLGLPREPSADADKSFTEVLRDAHSWGRR
jgi:alkylation response protein AidB-like acyl-CoA dehydrogenase